jgi:hypothetical protein
MAIKELKMSLFYSTTKKEKGREYITLFSLLNLQSLKEGKKFTFLFKRHQRFIQDLKGKLFTVNEHLKVLPPHNQAPSAGHVVRI